mmetsp:Transcript_33618/g.92842  ORF Transcript_33618/g.92842 Transcript_33618/m.92842 type:complete len:232 (-) Transcript_33618:366-1061(-)
MQLPERVGVRLVRAGVQVPASEGRRLRVLAAERGAEVRRGRRDLRAPHKRLAPAVVRPTASCSPAAAPACRRQRRWCSALPALAPPQGSGTSASAVPLVCAAAWALGTMAGCGHQTQRLGVGAAAARPRFSADAYVGEVLVHGFAGAGRGSGSERARTERRLRRHRKQRRHGCPQARLCGGRLRRLRSARGPRLHARSHGRHAAGAPAGKLLEDGVLLGGGGQALRCLGCA